MSGAQVLDSLDIGIGAVQLWLWGLSGRAFKGLHECLKPVYPRPRCDDEVLDVTTGDPDVVVMYGRSAQGLGI